jgi:hypothetical protein
VHGDKPSAGDRAGELTAGAMITEDNPVDVPVYAARASSVPGVAPAVAAAQVRGAAT